MAPPLPPICSERPEFEAFVMGTGAILEMDDVEFTRQKTKRTALAQAVMAKRLVAVSVEQRLSQPVAVATPMIGHVEHGRRREMGT